MRFNYRGVSFEQVTFLIIGRVIGLDVWFIQSNGCCLFVWITFSCACSISVWIRWSGIWKFLSRYLSGVVVCKHELGNRITDKTSGMDWNEFQKFGSIHIASFIYELFRVVFDSEPFYICHFISRSTTRFKTNYIQLQVNCLTGRFSWCRLE